MNKKEVLEIRKQFTPENCAITRICGCYVDHEKEKKTELKKAFLSLPEEEAFKYFDIFRHTLSGTIGKNLINMEFPLDQELPGGTQEFLLKLRDSKLEDDLLIEEFMTKLLKTMFMPRIITSFSSTQSTMYQVKRLTAWKCSTHLTLYTSILCAASVR